MRTDLLCLRAPPPLKPPRVVEHVGLAGLRYPGFKSLPLALHRFIYALRGQIRGPPCSFAFFAVAFLYTWRMAVAT